MAACALVGAAPGRAAEGDPAPSAATDDISIPFTKTTLPNGMTVILSADHSLPVVSVNIGYWVGSRFEEPHRTGFAHLFEHLMFLGTRRAPHSVDEIEANGGEANAWTSEDPTDYTDVAPAGALDLLLWHEADRMRDIGPLMTKAKLDPERDVVRNERRQTVENTPYGLLELRVPALLYPEGHPYHHSVIGSHEDLEAAQVDDVKAFFARYYDPANASLCIAGDFDPKEAMGRIQEWFATIPSRGKPVDPSVAVASLDSATTTLKSAVRETDEDNVELAKTTMAWQAPKHFAAGDAELEILGDVLTKGKESRLYTSLVYEQKLAQDVTAVEDSGVLGSRFVIDATARPGVSLDRLEAAVDAELAKVRSTPVTDGGAHAREERDRVGVRRAAPDGEGARHDPERLPGRARRSRLRQARSRAVPQRFGRGRARRREASARPERAGDRPRRSAEEKLGPRRDLAPSRRSTK